MSKTAIYLDENLTALELALENVNIMVHDLTDDFFVWDEKRNTNWILGKYEDAAARSCIAADYLKRAKESAKELRKLIDSMPVQSNALS